MRILSLRAAIALLCLMLSSLLHASDQVSGDRWTFTSPGGVSESCVALARMPGGNYAVADAAQERTLCAIDVYSPSVALCPKLSSTSPGTFIYQLGSGPYAGRKADFEHDVCPRGKTLVPEADGPPVSFKVSMNERDTSGTFAKAPLLYHHLAAYFDLSVFVPAAVYRSIDRNVHAERVTARGLKWSAGKSALRMNHAGWQTLDRAERDPSTFHDASEIFTSDGSQVYGTLLHVQGHRYGAEINGTRKSGWGAGQNNDFQQTAPFLALRSESPLQEAIVAGQEQAGRDPELRKAMGHGVSPAQMVFWMQDLVGITLLDFIFSQQDRIGNIDYVDYWHWFDGDELRLDAGSSPPQAVSGVPQRIRRTWLNDNDAGGRPQYANYTRKTGMLEKLRHYNASTYRRLMALDRDLREQGPLYGYLHDTFGLTKGQFEAIVRNAQDAAAILRASCERGELRFDLDAMQYLRSGTVTETTPQCNA